MGGRLELLPPTINVVMLEKTVYTDILTTSRNGAKK